MLIIPLQTESRVLFSSTNNIERYTFNYLVSVTCYDINALPSHFWYFGINTPDSRTRTRTRTPLPYKSISFAPCTGPGPPGPPGPSEPGQCEPCPGLRSSLTAASRSINSQFCLNPFWPTEPEPAHLQVVYKSDVHARCSFAGIHAEGKHVIQGSRHVCDDLSPLNPATTRRVMCSEPRQRPLLEEEGTAGASGSLTVIFF